MNQVAIRSTCITPALAEKYLLVPDTHDGNLRWWKIVLMDHVRESLLEHFRNNLEKEIRHRVSVEPQQGNQMGATPDNGQREP
jgi:hypothetical protein